MKQRRKFELLIADIRSALADPARKDRYGNLWHSTWNLARFDDELAGDIAKVRELIAVARAFREATGPGRSVGEQMTMQSMRAVVSTCCDALEDAGLRHLPDLAAAETLAGDLRQRAQIVAELHAYAMECLRSNARRRDAFAGARRGLAFEILGAVGWTFDLPEALDLARQALRRNRSQEAGGAILFLEEYFAAREDIQVPDDIHAALLAAAENTDSRSTATGALNVLVESGEVTDLDALDRLDDWKDKHDQ
jgi:hypothetical protein